MFSFLLLFLLFSLFFFLVYCNYLVPPRLLSSLLICIHTHYYLLTTYLPAHYLRTTTSYTHTRTDKQTYIHAHTYTYTHMHTHTLYLSYLLNFLAGALVPMDSPLVFPPGVIWGVPLLILPSHILLTSET